MYDRLGQAVVRHAALIVAGWALLVALVWFTAPPWRAVTRDGEFAFLPPDAETQIAARIYEEAFPKGGRMNPLDSNIVIVAHRDDRPRPDEGMAAADFEFIEETIVPELQRIAATTGKGYEPLTPEEQLQTRPELPDSERLVTGIFTRPSRLMRGIPQEEDVIGALMQSDDKRASLVYVQLNSEMLDRSNRLIISEVERRIINNFDLNPDRPRPLGLALDLSGTAVVGRDVLLAEQESASRTESLTVGLVVFLLLAIYRAPLLAMIPLITVGLSVFMTQRLLALLAGWGWIGVFTGLEVYITVVVYGAGVDYCLFLIARYREELDHGMSFAEAIRASVTRVGAALATSAGTSIFGIGMLAFADFGKFSQAGIAISIGLTVVLLSSVTFTPALLRLSGRWAFWPDLRRERLDADAGWLPTLKLSQFLQEQQWLERGWQRMASLLMVRPGIVFASTLAALLPFAVVGLAFQNDLNYGLLTDLPADSPSVLGARAVQQHFPPGVSGPIVVLLEHPDFDLKRRSQLKVSEEIVEAAYPHLKALGVVDVRSQSRPLGRTETANEIFKSTFRNYVQLQGFASGAQKIYASLEGPLAGQVMRLDLILNHDPFVRESIQRLPDIEAAVRAAVPAAYQSGLQVRLLGPTANLRELKLVTDADRMLIDVLVAIVVYVLLVALLRRPAICAYLLLTVIFSYLVTLGATYLVFRLALGGEFAGLDWKIPLFLFTILIAIGEDYNILLMARVTEEQERHGLIQGVLVALTKTGSIISSCGIIMAGTFASLMTGTLLGMVEMGFALSFGVLLDTFVVRPVLVPTYLILLYSGRFGAASRWLGAGVPAADEAAPSGPPPAQPALPDDSGAALHGELTQN